MKTNNIYEVWIKGGIDLDYFGSREAAELYIQQYIKKREIRRQNGVSYGFSAKQLHPKMTREDFEIREKSQPVGCDYGIGG